MIWEIGYTDKFGGWWDTLTHSEQASIAASVTLLSEKGMALPYPYSSK